MLGFVNNTSLVVDIMSILTGINIQKFSDYSSVEFIRHTASNLLPVNRLATHSQSGLGPGPEKHFEYCTVKPT